MSKCMIEKGEKFQAIVVRGFMDVFINCTIVEVKDNMVKFMGQNATMKGRKEVKIVDIHSMVFTNCSQPLNSVKTDDSNTGTMAKLLDSMFSHSSKNTNTARTPKAVKSVAKPCGKCREEEARDIEDAANMQKKQDDAILDSYNDKKITAEELRQKFTNKIGNKNT